MDRVNTAIAASILTLAVACSSGNEEAAESPGATATPASGGSSTMVVLSTNHGDITIELFPEQAPISVENFLQYVDDGYYDGLIFHRVIPGFMIQGGGMDAGRGEKATRPAIKNEADNGLKNERGTLAMARTSDINSATSQFFINLVDNTFLDHGTRDFGYAVFGRVTEGMDVVDKIGAVQTRPGDVPVETVVIESMKRR